MTRLPPPPALPRPPARVGFPVVAVVAPVIAATAIGLITGSAFVLVFALLSPLIAIATMVDGRRTARRHRREEAARFDRECLAFAAAIDAAHAAESALDSARAAREEADPAGSGPFRVGVGPGASEVAPEAPLVVGDSEPEQRLERLMAGARVNPARAIVVPRGDLLVVGSGRAARGVMARLGLEPNVRVLRSPRASGPPITEIRVHSAVRLEVIGPDGVVRHGRPVLASALELDERRRARADGSDLPSRVAWRTLPTLPPNVDSVDEPTQAGLAPESTAGRVPVGLAVHGDALRVAVIDLAAAGPHVLVGGTTGSGKSEFLRTVAIGWAAEQPPSRLQLLFVDFKGGATFTDLLELPHAIGLVTDLGPLVAERTILALRAELRRRERVLVENGVRDAALAPELLPRLVVLVDEYAALIETFPELSAAFADLSARGRSLGVHLALGTQHPASAVRDAVAANCALRIAFRLSESAGAAFIGPSGHRLSGLPTGRALVVGPDGESVVQVALIDRVDIMAVVERWAGHPGVPEPWLPPLPHRVDAGDLVSLEATTASGVAPPSAGLPFGMIDDPGELVRSVATWDPVRDGPLAVIGCSGSGRSSALAALAEAAAARGRPVITLPGRLPGAWELLEQLSAASARPLPDRLPLGPLLLADDLDHLLGEAAERGPELLALWDSAVRGLRRRGGGAAAAVGPVSASRTLLGPRFSERLLLRALDADDHAIAGAPRGLYDRSAPPGRGWWRERQVQVAAPRHALVVDEGAAESWWPPDDRATVVIAAAVDSARESLLSAYPEREVVRATAPEHARSACILVADPEAWQGAWASLSELRRQSPVIAIGIGAGELRALVGVRSTPPPLEPERAEVWLVEPGGSAARRVGLPTTRGPSLAAEP